MATTSTPVVPTISAKTFITDIPTSIAYVIRHFVSSPKSANETLYQYIYSMQDIISRNPGDPNAICNATSSALSQIFNNIYGQSSSR